MSGIGEEEGYIKTTTHNYVSRKATIAGAKQVEIKGRSIVQDGVVVKGDLAVIRIGRYCEINSNTVLEPAIHPLNPSQRIPMVIGSHSHIGKDCNIQAAAIGSHVWIGENVQIGPRVIIKDNCIIDDNVRLGADTVVPPFTRIASASASSSQYNQTELPPSMSAYMQEVSLDRYQEFKLVEKDQ